MESKESLPAVKNEQEFSVAISVKAIETIRANLGGELPSAEDLTKIKVPAGGGTSWEITSIDGEPEICKSIEGVIVHVARRRAYWPTAGASSDPPQCYSTDCVTGIGDPGGPCVGCQLNQFGSAVKEDGRLGRGKACKETRLVFLLRQGNVVPEILVVPPASLRPLRKYLLQLTTPYWSVVTRFTLEKSKNRDGTSYSTINASRVSVLDERTAALVAEYVRQLGEVFAAATVASTDVEDESPHEV